MGLNTPGGGCRYFEWMFSRSLHRTNPASVAALLVGVALIPVGVGGASTRWTPATGRCKMKPGCGESGSTSFYSRARSLALITAGEPGLRNFYAEPGSVPRRLVPRNEAVRDDGAAASREPSGMRASSTAAEQGGVKDGGR